MADARCTPSVVRRRVALRRFANGSDAGIADPLEALPDGGGRGGRDVVYGDIGAVCDGDWPGWPAQEMLAWIPRRIQERYGRRSTSFVSGDCLVFPPEAERDLVAALAALGYACERDDALVRRASGYASEEGRDR